MAIPIAAQSNQTVQTAKPTQTQRPAFKEEEKSLSNDAYKIYLVKKYPLEFNDVLKKYIFKDKLFDSVDDALIVVHQTEIENETSDRTRTYYTNKREAISFLNLIKIEVSESTDGKITVSDKDSTHYFYKDVDFLDYANKKATYLHK